MQNALGEVLLDANALHRLFTWQDSAHTTLLYISLVLLTAILAAIPWGVVVPFVVTWLTRLVGLALLGPHMYWVGRKLEAIEVQTARDAAAAAAAADSSARRSSSAAAASAAAAPSGATPPLAASPFKAATAVAAMSSAPAFDDDDDDGYIFEVDSAPRVPRQPCLPDVRANFELHVVDSSSDSEQE